MVSTPIVDFVKKYAAEEKGRFHMPGHKGKSFLGFESMDLTEIDGADSLFDASGIIAESERIASSLFGCHTFYSTEGSSLCIRAMLFLALSRNPDNKKILAGRNAHKTFLNSAALLDLDVAWIYPEDGGSYLGCNFSLSFLEKEIEDEKPFAVYLTNPDYLGNIIDLKPVAEICHKHNVLLIVDNAHGAYLRYLRPSIHPMDLGADICCDSAHKTLPCLTGGAYLHTTDEFADGAKNALALFASTSPSYLILESLDMCNRYMEELPMVYKDYIPKINKIKYQLKSYGYVLCENEPDKITISAKDFGYTGSEIADILKKDSLYVEFYDNDFIGFMVTPENTDEELEHLVSSLRSISKRDKINESAPLVSHPEKVLSPRSAIFSKKEKIPCAESLGRILAYANVGCPPAIPIIMCGEKIDEAAITSFKYYGVEKVWVVKE